MVQRDFCLEHQVRIYNLTARDHFKVHGINPHMATTGEEADISNVSTYGWYEWCYYREHTNRFPHNQEVLDGYWGLHKGKEMRLPSVSLRQIGT